MFIIKKLLHSKPRHIFHVIKCFVGTCQFGAKDEKTLVNIVNIVKKYIDCLYLVNWTEFTD